MPWHRDTYLDKTGNLVGRVPPLIKVIFYPKLEDVTCHELSVLDGSSKRVFKHYILDKLQRYFFKETKFFQSNGQCSFGSDCVNAQADLKLHWRHMGKQSLLHRTAQLCS